MSNPSPSAIIARLDMVDWHAENVERFALSRSRLMSEYLRRSALWARHYNAEEHWPFGDIVEYAAPGFELDRELELRLEHVLKRPGIGGLGARMARAAVRWAALSECGTEALPDLPAPYEPLVSMFERGGSFFEEVFIDLSGYSLPRGTLQERANQTPFEFSRITLDAIDIVNSPGIAHFYLIPPQKYPCSVSAALTRRVDIGASEGPIDSILNANLRWSSTDSPSEIERFEGGALQAFSISEEQAITIVEKMLQDDRRCAENAPQNWIEGYR